MSKRQPYVSASGPEIYLPRWAYGFNQARHEAASIAQESIGNWGRSRYLGKQAVPLHDHADWEECLICPEESVWAFETYEGTYR